MNLKDVLAHLVVHSLILFYSVDAGHKALDR